MTHLFFLEINLLKHLCKHVIQKLNLRKIQIGKQNKKLLLNEDGSLTERGEKIIRNTPMKRFGNADELSGAIHFLSSESSSFITGIVLPVDGGFSAYSGV